VRRIVPLVISASLAIGLFGALAGPAGAQTGDVAAACAARIEANGAQGKAANLAVMNKLVSVAPASLAPAMTALRDAYQKKGEKLFNGPDGLALLTPVDTWVYDNCPGTQVPVTAIDYEYQGVPATLKPGVTKFKLTNAAPKEDHMMAIVKELPAAQGQDLTKLLSLPEKQQGKYFDQSGGTFMFAPAGQVGYGPVDLTPGTYAYACFLPQGGKRNGKPHFLLGMSGTFTVA
jgi:hypothetical protein